MSDLFLNPPTQTTETPSDAGFLTLDLKAKELLPQINWILTQRKTEYVPSLIALQAHPSIQIKRRVATGLSQLASKTELSELKDWQSRESDRETWVILESTIDKIERGVDGQQLEQNARIYSVSEVLILVKKILGEGVYTIEGELSDVHLSRQMYYFAIKDNADARLDCWAFSGVVSNSGFPLNEGLAVRVTGKFKLSRNSRLIFDIQTIQLTGEGELLRNLQLLEQKLRMEGLFSPDRKRKISRIPAKILLLASPTSAAVSDFQKVLQARRGGLEVYFLPIKSQGVGAEFELLEQLKRANQVAEKYNINTIVLTRGGGGKDDLILFNSEKVVRAIHGLIRPSIVAIGHERDTTLAELVADLRASTPSNAAELVTLGKDQILNQTNSITQFTFNYFLQREKEYHNATNQLFTKISTHFKHEIQEGLLLSERVNRTVRSLLYEVRLETQKIWHLSLASIQLQLRQARYRVESVSHLEGQTLLQVQNNKLVTNSVYSNIFRLSQDMMRKYRNDFDAVYGQLLLQDPAIVLAKGYAIVSQNDTIVTQTNQIKKNTPIRLKMQDGEIEV